MDQGVQAAGEIVHQGRKVAVGSNGFGDLQKGAITFFGTRLGSHSLRGSGG